MNTAFSSQAPFAPGDEVTTDFQRYEARKIRIVKDVYQHQIGGKFVWWVLTECGMSLGSGWFEKVKKHA